MAKLWPIFDLGLQKNFEPKIQKKPGFFWILGSNFLVCAKSIFTLILKVSDKFVENVGGVGFLVNDTWAKWGFEIWPLW